MVRNATSEPKTVNPALPVLPPVQKSPPPYPLVIINTMRKPTLPLLPEITSVIQVLLETSLKLLQDELGNVMDKRELFPPNVQLSNPLQLALEL
jgi:hypothetical protein